MLDLPQSIPMFASSSIDAVDDVDAKFNATHLYYQKPHAVQIIQLVECAPPPRRIVSPESLCSSSYASSSYCSEEEDEEDESECSSYCSSAEPVAQESCSPQLASSQSETYSLRMKRILAWREDFSSHLSTTLSDSSIPSSLKRKMSINSDEIDSVGCHFHRPQLPPSISFPLAWTWIADKFLQMSHTSKRSRSQASSRDEGTSTCSSLGALSCPACDASFDTRQDLRQHGHDARAGANEACFVAVDYAFE
ncbi:hypothetical protein GYMLUDRAFT_248849 [Collybiopsis luxurians FD-317 M1]|uniref:Uncharacterized protein n=1 Tax=Collybiopsis luxurians FD-317 M1 TaxID=944289 RepID=A0A0D0AX98_9AGAR|nr:hypothetical protein GYMLUDRAFT_248849 [Collybiopsis luxurians FD-317 M1]